MPACQQCKIQFNITDADKVFYRELDVPEPKLCPDCRNQRRMSLRNERTFYPRTCAGCKKAIIAYYPATSKQAVYCPTRWYSDKWSPYDYGCDFDFTKPFFPQFKTLYQQVPTLSLDVVNCENSEYVSYCGDDKSCYLDIAGEANERCLYGKFIKYCKDCVDNSFVYHSELCYECVNCHKCYGSIWLENCHSTVTSNYCYDLRGCSDCTYCYNLRNKKYCIFNKQYTPAEYTEQLAKLDLNYETFLTKVKQPAVIKYANIINSENCTGNDIANTKNCQSCFDVTNSENSQWLYDVLDAKDCYDLNFSLYKPEKSYELISTLNMVNSKFCCASHYCMNMTYCDKCNNSHDCFGSIGITKGEYVILNKPYSATEYQDIKNKIINHMRQTGEYGEFFPVGTTGFGYNETVASEYYPLTKAEATARQWPWQDHLPFTTGKTGPGILTCKQCQRNYKIIAQEQEFYQQQHLLPPTICPECRHRNRNQRSGGRCLQARPCSQCGKTVMTVYPKAEAAGVYCEQCYNKAIY